MYTHISHTHARINIGETLLKSKRRGGRCGRGTRRRGLLDPEWAGMKRMETLGFSLETDDACGSLRVRDYERQLEIRSKQMDCENTSFLPRSHIHARVLSRLRRSSLSCFLSSSLSRIPCLPFTRRELQATWTDAQIFLYLYQSRRDVVPPAAVGRRNLNTDKTDRPLIAK